MNQDFYSSVISSLKKDIANKRSLENKKSKLNKQLLESQSEYVRMINAQKLLSAVSDDNTQQTLDFITGVVNKTLAEIFKGDTRRIFLKKKLFAQSKPHIVVELRNGEGHVMNMQLQNGAGLRQVVSFMYVLCLIEIRKGRRLVLSDEKLNGLHKEAKRIISEIIKIFAEDGFQFIFVEYSLNHLGKLYNVEKHGTESRVISLDGVEYDDSCVFADVDLDILDKDYKEDDESVKETIIGG
mgnify:CR=1 FL=1|jgi:hypothetical protein